MSFIYIKCPNGGVKKLDTRHFENALSPDTKLSDTKMFPTPPRPGKPGKRTNFRFGRNSRAASQPLPSSIFEDGTD